MTNQEIINILNKTVGYNQYHRIGSIDYVARIYEVNDFEYPKYYNDAKEVIESLPWNRYPELVPDQGDYLVMLDCDEHRVLEMTYKNNQWLMYPTHINWWMELPKFK